MIYTVHLKSDARPLPGDESGESRFDKMVAIPESFAPWAALFPPIWLIFHRLWFSLLIYCGIIFSIFTLLVTPYAVASLLLGGLPGIFLLLEGHQLRRYKLRTLGYDMIGVVDAPAKQYALEKFLHEWDAPELPHLKPKPLKSYPATDHENSGISLFPPAQV